MSVCRDWSMAMRGISAAMVAALVVACRDAKPNVTFSDEGPGTVRPYAVLKSVPDSGTKGWPGTQVHIALAPSLSNADQRATVQHVIDSVAARDTSVFWLRVTAFVPEKAKPGASDVPLYATLQGIWAPPDTNDPASRSHRSVHRTFFTVIPAPVDSALVR